MGKGSSGFTPAVTRAEASDDWFEYENANAMSEYIRTGRMPTKDMYGNSISEENRAKLKADADLIQKEGTNTNSGYKTLYRGMTMDEADARALTPGQTYTTKTLTATTPDRKMANTYANTDNYFGEGTPVSVILEMQKPDGIHGFKRDNMETVLPKGSSFKITRNYMDENGVVHISLYKKKGKK